MKEMGLRKNKVLRRFFLSFLMVLCLPIFSFSIVFHSYYGEVYRREIIKQAENSLSVAGMELERKLENMQQLASYNRNEGIISSVSILKDYRAAEVKTMLRTIMVSNYHLKDIWFYSYLKPADIYNIRGTYKTEYFAEAYGGMQESQLLEILQGKSGSELVVWKDEVYYVVRDIRGQSASSVWIFTLSEEALEKILGQESAVTMLQNGDGSMLYSTVEVSGADCYEIVFTSSGGQFRLVRQIDQESLFADLDTWQRNFFIVILVLLILGGSLVFCLTYYNEYPIRKLQSYVRGRVQDIPEDISGLEVFQYAMKSMEERALLLEKKQKVNRLLLHLIYAGDCDEEYFDKILKEAALFEKAECYRVILMVSLDGYDDNLNKTSLYLQTMDKTEYEFRLIDVPGKDAMIIIVGMSENAEKNLERQLSCIAEMITHNVGEEIRFFVGGKCSELKMIHTSYAQALSCRQGEQQIKQSVVYFNPKNVIAESFQYPSIMLNLLYDALMELDIDKAFRITDSLIGILEEQSTNRFVSVSLYYDVLNVYYRAQTKLELDIDSAFLEVDLLEARDYLDAIQMILRIKEQYKNYVEMIKRGDDDRRKGRTDDEEIVQRILCYIDENSKSGNLNASMVADSFDMSLSLIGYKFKKCTGRTLSDYITEKKFAYACELLLESDCSVGKIADMTGYSHPVSFIRKFKQLYGMTPMEYREMEKINSSD